MQVVGAVEQHRKDRREEQAVLAAAETEASVAIQAVQEPQILAVVVAVEVTVVGKLAVQVVQALSSSRPINNEDKWKPKSIGCMESTPQCTC
jgi:hypothetical protein